MSQSASSPPVVIETKRLPSLSNVTHVGHPKRPLSVCRLWHATTSHNMMVPSWLDEANNLPSGLNVTHQTCLLCPLKVARTLPVLTSQSLMVVSELPVATIPPLG